MSATLYLSRRVIADEKSYTEAELLAASKYVVVLAEPGAGKTELMESLAQQLGTKTVTANVFSHTRTNVDSCPLVIDAFDELSKVDQTGIYKLLANAKETNPSHVIISSRSSEWGSATTNAFNEFFGNAPIVVRLYEFTGSEQQAIFNDHVPGEDFAAFQAEIARFDLEMLLPNPQFLKLFAGAYIEGERHFPNKRSIFEQAVEYLAKEANENVQTTKPTLSTAQKIELTSEAFAKLLLSGAEGVGISEASEDRIYPLLASLFSSNTVVNNILATQLFKPGNSSGQHRPVHKIVTEYCAASYLTKRIMDPSDSLTMLSCLAIIAPNSIVRDELRGLLGWMAALGNKTIEKAAIELDPYAVLANGDPSQLETASKCLLIKQLKEIEIKDPYFRMGDFRRRFSVAGFLDQKVVDEIKPILVAKSDGDLQDLLLELLVELPGSKYLSDELRQLTLTPTGRENTRLLASRCLVNIAGYDYYSDLKSLISEATHTSIRVAFEIFEAMSPESLDKASLAAAFQACATLYPDHDNNKRPNRTIGDRYFVKLFIDCLTLETIEWLLNDLTRDLSCNCGKKFYHCDCRIGISKIVGILLDNYFKLAKPPFDGIKIWQWMKNLNFRQPSNLRTSRAVQVLQEDNDLRQGIIAHVFGKMTNPDHINKAQREKFGMTSHSGLNFRPDDYKFVVDLAFNTDNPGLWGTFIARHMFHHSENDHKPDNTLRRRMREQASEKSSLMRVWAQTNREAKQLNRKERKWHCSSRLRKKHQRQQDNIHEKNITFAKENRQLIESGCHWGYLEYFTDLTFMNPARAGQGFDDKDLVRNALRNCIGFITKYIPSLPELAQMRCASQGSLAVRILHASSLEILREKGNLEDITPELLKALRTDMNMHYYGVNQEDKIKLKNEVDRLLFSDAKSADEFLREYVEPQLGKPDCDNATVWLLKDEEAFTASRARLSMEWLKRYQELAPQPLDTLFDIAAQYGNRDDLEQLIIERCAEFISDWPNQTDNEKIEKRRMFWFVRAWYFLKDTPEIYWNWLKADKDTIFILNHRSGRINRGDHPYWPELTSSKVETILDAFIEQWPKVELLDSWGTGDPNEETAYRFLTEIIWLINSDVPEDAIPVLNRLVADPRLTHLHKSLKSILTSQNRARALRDFEPPLASEIVALLDQNTVVTVEGLRKLILQELNHYQAVINGGEYNDANRFYEQGKHLNENDCTEIIAGHLNVRLEPQAISITPEHQQHASKRSDFTATKLIDGKRRLLVTEVKGQWHPELYSAASSQLHERYAIHPDAEQQGIFIVIWFGSTEKVAGRKTHGIISAPELKNAIEAKLPSELSGLIDVFVLDVSNPPAKRHNKN